MRIRPAWLHLCGLAIAVLVVAGQPLGAATPEAQVKAAYLYKMASFVRWPDQAEDGPFRICIAGRADIAAVVEQLAANELVNGQRIAVTQLGAGNADLVRSCQILFLGRGGEQARGFLAAIQGAPVLVVTDRSHGSRGGVVEFVLHGGRVRFVVDRSEAEARQLQLSSKLIDVALEIAP